MTAAEWVASATSGQAHTHPAAVYAIATVLNLVAFWSVALPLWVLSRKRRPLFGMVAVMFFAAFYIGALFWLFPATDFP